MTQQKAIKAEARTLNPNTVMVFYEIDLTPLGGTNFRLHPGVNEKGEDVVWRGQTYTRFPLQAEGYERSGKGAVPRPTIRIANIGTSIDNQAGAAGLLALEWGDLVGCRVIRHMTLAKYIDAVNFKDGNPHADPNQYFPPEVFFVDSKKHEDPQYIEFELVGATDLIGVRVPGSQVTRSVCMWAYRSEECGYTGPPCADKDDKLTDDPKKDACGHRLSSCKLRFGENGTLPCRIFPGVGRQW